MKWHLTVKFKRREDFVQTFTSRPTLSEGPCLFRVASENEGEFWFQASEVEEATITFEAAVVEQ